LSGSSTANAVGAPLIAADSAAASTVTSSAGRRAPSRGWPLRGRRRCRS
jgi:hypothetical protein